MTEATEAPRASVFSRLAATSVILALVLALATLAFFLINGLFLRHTLQRTLDRYSRTLAHQGWTSEGTQVWQKLAQQHRVTILIYENGTLTRAFDEAGRPIADDSLPSPSTTTFERQLEGPRSGQRVVFLWNLDHFTSGHLVLLAFHLLLLTLLVAAMFAFLRRQLRPLRWLQAAVEDVARGELESRVPVVRDDEIGRVATAFNRMAEQVGKMVGDRERLLADVSHELRSPLARMKVAVELLPADNDYRESLRRDTREMETLISVLLERESLRARATRLKLESVDLEELIREVIAPFSREPPGVVCRGREQNLPAAVDPALFRLLLHNLIANAIKFSQPDSKSVEVALSVDDRTIELVVRDDGVGIPPAQAARMLEPFVKLDPSRGHRSGHGLGLDLCRRIAEAHDGKIELTSDGVRGTLVTVTLPNRQL